MATTDDLPEVIRAEFARLENDDAELTDWLESAALAAVDGLDPTAAAGISLALVERAHEVGAAVEVAAGPTVGQLSARRLVLTALRPRRTTEPRS